ncbi:hypothetical protein ONS95_014568 [Cadophora gregata]|uniref:uncharacterized protein n=1 Tax=Cadophora gregata TaxID=51156 RepID=UPI0026DBB745|nr:uncharacterized protein ONS95_014568 [Cadophora gregata]KAK0112842.1 hypothetical protein ONS95_014568 [Cadophora gregata]KAK0124909.1 hypothetical protein ONS96_008786 [Cadophora gregata f. sp. sojae]
MSGRQPAPHIHIQGRIGMQYPSQTRDVLFGTMGLPPHSNPPRLPQASIDAAPPTGRPIVRQAPRGIRGRGQQIARRVVNAVRRKSHASKVSGNGSDQADNHALIPAPAFVRPVPGKIMYLGAGIWHYAADVAGWPTEDESRVDVGSVKLLGKKDTYVANIHELTERYGNTHGL